MIRMIAGNVAFGNEKTGKCKLSQRSFWFSGLIDDKYEIGFVMGLQQFADFWEADLELDILFK